MGEWRVSSVRLLATWYPQIRPKSVRRRGPVHRYGFVPQQMRALIGDDCENLDQAALRRIDDTIDLFDRAGLLIFSKRLQVLTRL